MNGTADPNDPRPSGRVKLTLSGRINGLDVTAELDCDVRKLAATVAYVQAQGLEAPPRALEFSRTAEGLPICPRHGVPMKPREKQGDTWHSHPVRTPDGQPLYCRGYPGPSSPGYYEHDAQADDDEAPASLAQARAVTPNRNPTGRPRR